MNKRLLVGYRAAESNVALVGLFTVLNKWLYPYHSGCGMDTWTGTVCFLILPSVIPVFVITPFRGDGQKHPKFNLKTVPITISIKRKWKGDNLNFENRVLTMGSGIGDHRTQFL